MNLFFKKSLLIVVILLQASCALVSPKKLPQYNDGFNNAVQVTEDQQFLMNLVRLKYRDTPNFMDLTNISMSTGFSTNGGVRLSEIGEGSHTLFKIGGIDVPGVSYDQRPVYSFAPLRGTRFAEKMLTPINLHAIYMMVMTGWGADKILRMSVISMNHLRNDAGTSVPLKNSNYIPQYKEFVLAAEALRNLELKGAVHYGYKQDKDREYMIIKIDNSANDSADAQTFRQLLHIKRKTNQIIVANVYNGGIEAKADINVEMRCMLDVLYYLSNGVIVPVQNITNGTAPTTQYQDGKVFDWTNLTNGVIKIYSTKSINDDVAVQVRYRDFDYYIKNNDLDSKTTLFLLRQLFELTAGHSGQVSGGPMLTLPA